jgi:hypothetical protein
MARKRHRRRHRGFGDYVSIPSLSGLAKDVNPLGKSFKSTDVLLGVALGMAGGSLVKMGIGKLDVSTGGKVPAMVKQYVGPISTFLAGLGLYLVQRKKNSARAQAHLFGATIAAFSPLYWEGLKSIAPSYFNDYVTVSPFGVLTADQGMGGYGVLTQDSGGLGYSTDDEYDALSSP